MVKFGKTRVIAATLAIAALGALATAPAQAQTVLGINLSLPGVTVSAGAGAVAPAGYYPVYSPAPVAVPVPVAYPVVREAYPVYGQPVYRQPVRGWEQRPGWGHRADRDHDGVPDRFDRRPDNPRLY